MIAVVDTSVWVSALINPKGFLAWIPTLARGLNTTAIRQMFLFNSQGQRG